VKWISAIRQLGSISFQGAIVGPHGCGKTTLMEDLIKRLEGQGHRTCFYRLHTGERRLPLAVAAKFHALPKTTIALLDGAEQLSSWRWRQLSNDFFRTARPLIVTLHQTGRWPVWVQCKSDIAILDQMVDELLQGSVPGWQTINRQLFARHNGNIRDALREWYDLMCHFNVELNSTTSEYALVGNASRDTVDSVPEMG
jgi:hypothetical protein